MLGDQRFGEIAKQALAASKAEQTEIVLIGKDSALTRFANSTIHQNVFESNVELRARAVVGRRVGVASSNDLSTSGIADIVERALAMVDGPEAGLRELADHEADA